MPGRGLPVDDGRVAHVRTALVVDDDPGIRLLLRTFLESEGFDVLDADDGPTCLEVLGRLHPDVIVLDVMMPGMDGITVARHIKAGEAADVPIVMLTAAYDHERRWQARKAGVEAYLTKPVAMEHLHAEIETVCAGGADAV